MQREVGDLSQKKYKNHINAQKKKNRDKKRVSTTHSGEHLRNEIRKRPGDPIAKSPTKKLKQVQEEIHTEEVPTNKEVSTNKEVLTDKEAPTDEKVSTDEEVPSEEEIPTAEQKRTPNKTTAELDKPLNWVPSPSEKVQVLFDDTEWYYGIITRRRPSTEEAFIRFSRIDPKEKSDDGWYPYSEIFPVWEVEEDDESNEEENHAEDTGEIIDREEFDDFEDVEFNNDEEDTNRDEISSEDEPESRPNRRGGRGGRGSRGGRGGRGGLPRQLSIRDALLDDFDQQLLQDTVSSAELSSAENWEIAKQKVKLSDQQSIRGQCFPSFSLFPSSLQGPL